jgi:hypothetical protein
VNGEVYVAGSTSSAGFPGTAGGSQPAYAGNEDCFVARLNAGLTSLDQATYLGGTGADTFFGFSGLALHPSSGEVYVTGLTLSTDLPGTAGGAQETLGGQDAFVSRLNASLTVLIQSTYLGGNLPAGAGLDSGTAVAVHPGSGGVYVTGHTQATNFPGTSGGAQTSLAGGGDAFVAHLNSTLTTIVQATYLGGSEGDGGSDLAIHPTSGEIYVAGSTGSSDFPSTAGGAQTVPGNGFLARLDPALAATGTSFFTVNPCRVLDTREPAGPYGGPALQAGTIRTFTIAGACGIPVSSREVSVNITVTLPADAGHLRLFPGGAALPPVSSINYSANQTRANNAIVTLGPGGGLGVYCVQVTGTVHFILDVNGYFE